MPSPFPGMNPFLERKRSWRSFHTNFIVHAQGLLNNQLGPGYLADVEMRLMLHERSAEERQFVGIADVGVRSEQISVPSGTATAAAAPMRLQLPAVEVEKHRWLEIRDITNQRIVTVIELLSPSNKTPGDDREDYLAKRKQLLKSKTHFVEIDLRRGGGIRPAPPDLPICDYYVLVSKADERPNVDFWPIGLRDQLPIVPIPLADPDPPIHLDLKAVLDLSYDLGGYGRYIYNALPEPPLSDEGEVWARGILAQSASAAI